MRPVYRGPCPIDSSRNNIDFKKYGYARPYLIKNMGPFCSFCEMPVHSAMAVEHIRHKKNNGHLKREWDNFLLACHSCNSNKGTKIDTQADVDAHLWPHLDRTFDAFDYYDGQVKIVQLADATLAARAQNTADMVALLRRPGSGFSAEQARLGSDSRWEKRIAAWRIACVSCANLAQLDKPEMRDQIVATARGTGFWSVWMTVFHDDMDMQRRFCTEAFAGTALNRVF